MSTMMAHEPFHGSEDLYDLAVLNAIAARLLPGPVGGTAPVAGPISPTFEARAGGGADGLNILNAIAAAPWAEVLPTDWELIRCETIDGIDVERWKRPGTNNEYSMKCWVDGGAHLWTDQVDGLSAGALSKADVLAWRNGVSLSRLATELIERARVRKFDAAVLVPDAAVNAARALVAAQDDAQSAWMRRSRSDGSDHATVMSVSEPIEGGEIAVPPSWRAIDLSCLEPRGDVPRLLLRTDGAGLAYRGKLNMIFGESGSAKTWAADLAVVQEVLLGHHVAFVDMEDDANTTRSRLLDLGLTEPEMVEFVHYLHPVESLNEAVTDYVLGFSPSLVVVDSMTELLQLLNLDSNSGDDIAAAHQVLHGFTVDGAAVLMIDHVVKSKDSRGRYAIGSERKISGLNGSATQFEVAQPFGVGRHGISRLSVSKDRPGQVQGDSVDGRVCAEFHLRSGDPTTEEPRIVAELRPPVSGSGKRDRATEAMGKITRLLAENPQGLSKHVMQTRVGGNKGAHVRAVDTLIEDGTVVVRKVGSAHMLHLAEGGAVSPLPSASPDLPLG